MHAPPLLSSYNADQALEICSEILEFARWKPIASGSGCTQHSTSRDNVSSQRTDLYSSPSLALPVASSPALGDYSRSSGYSRAASPPTDAQILNGIVGEAYVYHILQAHLPGFTEENWTSELRGKVKGTGSFDGVALADFTYRDEQGMLTGIVFGEDKQRAWAEAWPTYHLEVKSTSGGQGNVFHMSASQLRAARELAIEPDTGVPPQHVYALVHVTEVNDGPKMTIIKEPHRALYTGVLRIASDVEIGRA